MVVKSKLNGTSYFRKNLGLGNIVIWPDNMAIFSRMEQLLTLQKPNMDAAKIYQWSWTLESVVISTAGYKASTVLCRGIIHFPHLRLIKFSANDPICGQSAIWETWMVFLIWESWIPEKSFLVKYQTVPTTLQWNKEFEERTLYQTQTTILEKTQPIFLCLGKHPSQGWTFQHLEK